jgi:hypothetical protein
MAANAAINPRRRLLMPVIIPEVWSESYAVTRHTQMNDERGAPLAEERRVLNRKDSQF